MASLAPAYVTLNPSFTDPGILLPYSQASGAFSCLADGQPLVRLSDGDLMVYMKRIELRTKVAGGQSAYNQLPSISTTFSYFSTPTYLLRVRAEYDHHDTAASAHWGSSIVDTQRFGMRQAHFQMARTALLNGMNPANGEGLLNGNGSTTVSLPADSNGNTTVSTYDNGQLGQFFLAQLGALKARTNQLGIGHKITILMPQRIGEIMEYVGIVQLTQFQRVGAGTATTAGMIKDVAEMNDDEVTWVYDDTLVGAGAGGHDAIIIVMPEVERPDVSGINTNEFAKLGNGIEACSLMYTDLAAPKEIPSPLAGGAIDVLSEWRITSGWLVRPEAATIISAQFI